MIHEDDIQGLQDLRDHLARVTERSRASYGLIYPDEIALLDRVIEALRSA